MKKTFSLIGMIVGAIIIVMGIWVFTSSSGSSYLQTTTFGGDFYTYSYKATKMAAENVYAVGKAMNRGIGCLIIAIGLTDFCIFGIKFAESKTLSQAVQMPAFTPSYTQENNTVYAQTPAYSAPVSNPEPVKEELPEI